MKVSLKPIDQQVIVITGASSGIGLATAKAAARKGAKVVLAARNQQALEQAQAEIAAAGGEAIHVRTDVSKREDLEALAAAAVQHFGTFDTWVNNAGIGIFGRLDEVTEANSRRLFDVNFWGLVNGSLIAANYLKLNGGGAIVNLGSVVSDIGFPVQGMYGASKHAIKGFTDAFRMEMQSEKLPVSITLIKPSAINTPFALHSRNYSSKPAVLPPPLYSPEDVAQTILHAAAHGGRDHYVGGGGKLMSSLNKHLPSVVDWFGANFIPGQSFKDEPSSQDGRGILDHPGDDGQVDGDSEHIVRRSTYTLANRHPILASAAVVAFGLGALRLITRNNQN